MVYTNEIIDRIITCINEDFDIPGICTAIRGYEADSLPIPITKTYFSIVPEENKVTYFENDNLEYCQKFSITIRLNCFAPMRRKSTATQALAEAVLDLVNDTFPDEIRGYTIGDMDYDDKIKAYRVTCRLYLEYETCAAESSSSDAVKVPANFFCKTHVTDTDAHLTAKEHDYLNEIFVTGTYTGTGTGNSNAIVLGFRPKCVLVCRHNYHLTYFDQTNFLQKNYAGMAFGTRGSRGVSLNSTGFTITQAETQYTQTLLNETDVTYNYIAFK